MVIDLHAHVVLEEAFGEAGAYGPALEEDGGVSAFRVGEYVMKPSPYRGSIFMDVEKRIAAMDGLGVGLQMLSPNPLSFLPAIESEAGDGLRPRDQRRDGGAGAAAS